MERVIEYYEYITRQGDTFDELALQYYNDEKLSHLIIDFNPEFSDYLILDEGLLIKIPIYEENQSVETLPPWKRETNNEIIN